MFLVGELSASPTASASFPDDGLQQQQQYRESLLPMYQAVF
jgi:hypothetical protein